VVSPEKDIATRAGLVKKTKILLINPPCLTDYPQPPLGLAMIASVLKNSSYEVKLLDLAVLGINNNDIASMATDFDVAGITAMTTSIHSALKLSYQLKVANPKLTIILGGPYVTLVPEETLKVGEQIDIVVRGEGEATIFELLSALENRLSLHSVFGISFRQQGQIIHNPERLSQVDMDSLPMPAYHLLPMDRYKPHPPRGRALPFAMMVTSRGCPYQCKFCAKPVFGSKYRAQSPDKMLTEIIYLQKYHGVKEIGFFDDIFVLDKERVMGLCRRLINEKIKLAWTCEARVNLVDLPLLRLMKAAGCYAVAYGIESASPEMLKALGKTITISQVEDAVRMTHQVGLQTIGYFMIGSPGETVETIQGIIGFAKKLKLDYAQFAITTCYPGTEFYKMYLETNKEVTWENFLRAEPDELLAPVFESEELNRSDLDAWARKAYQAFYVRPAYLLQRVARLKSLGEFLSLLKGILMLGKYLVLLQPIDKFKKGQG